MFGSLDEEWNYLWEDLKGEPRLTERGLRLDFKQVQDKFLMFGGTRGKVVAFPDDETASVSDLTFAG